MADAPGAHVWDNTATYEAYMGRWSRPAAAAILAWLGLPPGQTWLDVGCGTGALTRAILDAANPREVLGVDPSPAFVATATGQIVDPRVRFTVGDAGALPAPADAYDVVIAGLVLHFVPDPQLAVREMMRAAAPGGTVAAYVWDPAGDRQFTRYLWRAVTALDPAAAVQDPARQAPLSHPELASLFGEAGLQTVTAEAVVVPIMFRDFDDYWQPHLLGGSSPAQRYVATLTSEQQTALRERLHTMLPMAADGSLPLRGHVWAVRGTTHA